MVLAPRSSGAIISFLWGLIKLTICYHFFLARRMGLYVGEKREGLRAVDCLRDVGSLLC